MKLRFELSKTLKTYWNFRMLFTCVFFLEEKKSFRSLRMELKYIQTQDCYTSMNTLCVIIVSQLWSFWKFENAIQRYSKIRKAYWNLWCCTQDAIFVGIPCLFYSSPNRVFFFERENCKFQKFFWNCNSNMFKNSKDVFQLQASIYLFILPWRKKNLLEVWEWNLSIFKLRTAIFLWTPCVS